MRSLAEFSSREILASTERIDEGRVANDEDLDLIRTSYVRMRLLFSLDVDAINPGRRLHVEECVDSADEREVNRIDVTEAYTSLHPYRRARVADARRMSEQMLESLGIHRHTDASYEIPDDDLVGFHA